MSGHAARQASLPSAAYTEASQYEREKTRIFERDPRGQIERRLAQGQPAAR